MNQPRLLLIGAGAMGGALLRSWDQSWKQSQNNHSEYKQSFDTFVLDPNPLPLLNMPSNYIDNISKVYPKPWFDIIIFAIKPQVLIKEIFTFLNAAKPDCLFVSVAAGVGTPFLQQSIGKNKAIVRVMPNLPVMVGQGMSGLYVPTPLSEMHRGWVEALLSPSGKLLWLESEALLDVVTAVSGSGPAYFFRMVECLAQAAQAEGLSPEDALLLARQTAIGAGRMLETLPETPEALRKRVTSPGGTTAAALEVFNKDQNLEKLAHEAVKAAIQRAQELGQ